MAAVLEYNLIDDQDLPISLVQKEGDVSRDLIDRATRYFVTTRVNTNLDTPRPPAKPQEPLTPEQENEYDLAFIRHIVAHEEIGRIGDDWVLLPIRYQYGQGEEHGLFVPVHPDTLIRNVNDVRAEDLSGLFSRVGAYIEGDHAADTRGRQRIFGVNGIKNKTIGSLHFHYFTATPGVWQECRFEEIGEKMPHRYGLLTRNWGCYDQVTSIGRGLRRYFPDMIADGQVVTRGASCFLELTESLGQILQRERTAEMFQYADSAFRSSFGDIPNDKRCMATTLIQPAGGRCALLAVGAAAKEGTYPSGIAETANMGFHTDNEYQKMYKLNEYEQEDYLRRMQRIATQVCD